MTRFTLNRRAVQVALPSGEPLLHVIANDLGADGPKYGCGKAQCGSCTVLMDGNPVRSCVLPLSAADGRAITTLAGLAQGGRPGRLQQAFIDEQAAQCGYCITGIVMTAKVLLDANPKPTRAQITSALRDHLCRCGTHARIIKAVERAAAAMAAR